MPAACYLEAKSNCPGLSESLGWILIDRCGKHFGTILNYLRDDTIILPQNRQEIKELMAEAKYYLIQGLVSVCQTALQVWSSGARRSRRLGVGPSLQGCQGPVPGRSRDRYGWRVRTSLDTPGAAQAEGAGSQSVCQVTGSGSRTKASFRLLHLDIWI